MTDASMSMHSGFMGWNKIAMATWLGCVGAGCSLDSKSLGEDDTAAGSDDGSGDGSGSVSATSTSAGETEGGSLPPASRLWSATIDDVSAYSMSVAADGSIYVAGESGYSYEGGDGGTYASMWIGKFDGTGALVWSFEPGPDFGYIAATSDGFAVVTSQYGPDMIANLTRYHDDDELVPAVWSIPLEHGPVAIAVDDGDRIVVAGSELFEDGVAEGWAAAFDGDGNQLWESFYGDGETGQSTVQAAAFAPDGSVVLGGRYGIEPASSASKAWIAKVDASGATLWEQTVSPGNATDWVNGVDVTSDGTIHAVVWDGDGTTIRSFDPSGAQLSSFEPTAVTGPAGIVAADDGSVVLTDGLTLPFDDPNGCTTPWGPCPIALRVARHESDGSVRWFDSRDDCDAGTAAAILPDDRVVVLGACPPDIGSATVALGVFAYAP